MRKRNAILLGAAALLVVAAAATAVILAPGAVATPLPPAAPIAADEQAATIAAMRPPKRPDRPVIAIATFNAATETSDFLSAYGVLKRADVADVTVVAEHDATVRLYPHLSVEPDMTMAAFDARHPDGADYVVVPAMEPVDPFVTDWIVAQHRKGALIVSICNGAKTISAAGLLAGRRATGHWDALPELRAANPTMQWARDRRYVSDDGVTTSTGITANIPVMLALVEAIGGHERARQVADGLGVADWDARHRSDAFVLTDEQKKTFLRNRLSLWRHETVGIPVDDGVDEVALGLMADAYGRTELATVVAAGGSSGTIVSRHGLRIHPDAALADARVDEMLAPPPAEQPAATLERELPRIAARYDRQTAALVALVMEYPWAGAARLARQ